MTKPKARGSTRVSQAEDQRLLMLVAHYHHVEGRTLKALTELQEAFDQRPLDKSVQQWEQYRMRLRLLMDHFSSLQVIERFIRP